MNPCAFCAELHLTQAKCVDSLKGGIDKQPWEAGAPRAAKFRCPRFSPRNVGLQDLTLITVLYRVPFRPACGLFHPVAPRLDQVSD